MNRKVALSIVIAFLGVILSAGLVSATTYYVNSTIGEDTNDGSRSTPWRSIWFKGTTWRRWTGLTCATRARC